MRRFFKIIAGFALIAAGLIMIIPGVPGPGLLTIIGGLALLADYFHWARRLMDWGKAKLEAAKQKIGRRSSTS